MRTMINETNPDVFRTARLLVEEYGEFAPASAFIRADQLAESGSDDASQLWRRVGKIAEDLLAAERPENAIIH